MGSSLWQERFKRLTVTRGRGDCCDCKHGQPSKCEQRVAQREQPEHVACIRPLYFSCEKSCQLRLYSLC